MAPPCASVACHGHRRVSCGEPLDQPTPLVNAHEGGEHVGGDLTAGDLAVGELRLVKVPPCFCASDRWGRVDPSPSSQLHWVHVALTDFDIFFKCFPDFDANL